MVDAMRSLLLDVHGPPTFRINLLSAAIRPARAVPANEASSMSYVTLRSLLSISTPVGGGFYFRISSCFRTMGRHNKLDLHQRSRPRIAAHDDS